MWNEDEINGKAKKVKGTVKDKAGEILNNPDVEAEGELEYVEGEVQESIGEARRRIKKTVKKNLNKLKDS